MLALNEPPDVARVRADFDLLAGFDTGSGGGPYDAFLLAAVPAGAQDIFDVGCGTGALIAGCARAGRRLTGIDLSPRMIERANGRCVSGAVFLTGDFMSEDLSPASFDCVISSACLHHMPIESALARMASLVRPGGRLIVHDLRRNATIAENVVAGVSLALHLAWRFVRTGRVLQPRNVRRAWSAHGAGEHYMAFSEMQALASHLLPGVGVIRHPLWRFTLIWDKPRTVNDH